MLHDVIEERDSRIEERDTRIEERDRTIAMLRSRLADESSPMLFGFSASDIRRALTVLNADAPPVVAASPPPVVAAPVLQNHPRRVPCCKTCGQPRKGHARGPCVRV